MHLSKLLLGSCLGLGLFLVPVRVRADAITILSTDLAIWGGWSSEHLGNGGFGTAGSDGSPLAISVSPGYGVSASGQVSSFDLAVSASPPRDTFTWGSTTIHATAITRFTVDGPDLVLNLQGSAGLDYGFQGRTGVTLKDTTAGLTLLDLTKRGGYYSWAMANSFAADPNHVYELDLSGYIGVTEFEYGGQMSVHATIAGTNVPEDGTTCALLLASLGICGLLRRHYPRTGRVE